MPLRYVDPLHAGPGRGRPDAGEFLTNSRTGFVSGDDRAKRRRSEAINQLRKARSPWEQISKKRAFKSGHKGSTFPWAYTAIAVHEHTGRCWIASQIAIIGAASPFGLAYSKRAEATAFGTTGHPSELLAQTTAHSRNVGWWREQLEAIDETTSAERSGLALWCIASGICCIRTAARTHGRSGTASGLAAADWSYARRSRSLASAGWRGVRSLATPPMPS